MLVSEAAVCMIDPTDLNWKHTQVCIVEASTATDANHTWCYLHLPQSNLHFHAPATHTLFRFTFIGQNLNNACFFCLFCYHLTEML